MTRPVGSASNCCWLYSLLCGTKVSPKNSGEDDPLIANRKPPTPRDTPEQDRTVKAAYYAGKDSFK